MMNEETAPRREAISREAQSGGIYPVFPNFFTGKYHRRVTRNGFIRLPSAWLPHWPSEARNTAVRLPVITTTSQWRVSVIRGIGDALILLEPEKLTVQLDCARGFGEWAPQCHFSVRGLRQGLLQMPAVAIEALGGEISEVVLCGLLANVRLFSPNSWARCAAALSSAVGLQGA